MRLEDDSRTKIYYIDMLEHLHTKQSVWNWGYILETSNFAMSTNFPALQYSLLDPKEEKMGQNYPYSYAGIHGCSRDPLIFLEDDVGKTYTLHHCQYSGRRKSDLAVSLSMKIRRDFRTAQLAWYDVILLLYFTTYSSFLNYQQYFGEETWRGLQNWLETFRSYLGASHTIQILSKAIIRRPFLFLAVFIFKAWRKGVRVQIL